ncbi:hypothetical protein [Winogradskyella bathintestinalis]|uniref:Uncharacterized protein n=1 Tax=Winogradskyella bathintestinalis TaxID=3035208 RepID=A0ABT7ZWX1_9FLAO|nr:hypothetical protein [Winogradskyella bathintestinalis]MDN3493469.1 hypothetical protein [Winogradskyella bathintestinalis]
MPKTESLNEVVINAKEKKKLSAWQIVKKAITLIEDNHPIKPFSYIGYYRDYQFVDEEYVNLNEGIVEVFDQGFRTHKISDPLNNTALYSYKLNPNYIQDTLLSNAVYNTSKQIRAGKMGSSINNELTLLDIHNPIRNFNTGSFSFVYILEKDFVKNHKFYNQGIVFLDDEELYKIQFSSKQNLAGNNYTANGTIYVAKDDFSIHRFNYKLFSNRPRKLVFNINIEYKRQANNKMYLNYITFNNNFFITENDALKIESSFYDKNRGSFIIKFNRAIAKESLEKSNNVKLAFNDKNLSIHRLNLTSPKTVEVKFKNQISDFLNNQNAVDRAFFDLKLKNFEDILGFTMGKSKIEGYQFRELFVQRVFVDRKSPGNLNYLNKGKSLRHAPLNAVDINDYWLNSPLKQIKESKFD